MFEESSLPQPLSDKEKTDGTYFGHAYTTDAKLATRKKLIQYTNKQKDFQNNKKIDDLEQRAEKVDTRPDWFKDYVKKIREEKRDILQELQKLSMMKLDEINKHIGGNFEDLPYEIMDTLLVDGSESKDVVDILIRKRTDYIKIHPEKTRGVSGADEGIITFNGRFINKKVWDTASDSEKRSAMVGTTCFHYNSGTPNMDDSPNDRF